MILYDTTYSDAVGLLTAIHEREDNDRRFAASLHGIDIDEHGTSKVQGKSPMRRFHDRVSAKVRR